ncbi:hypothetical protein Tco_0266877 [Tanacetum coccineum]
MSRRVDSSKDQESLGVPEDASKQGRSIADIDADVEVTLVDETQVRQNDDLIFDTGVLDDVEMPVEAKVDGKDEQSTKTDDSTAGEAVTTAGDDSVVPTTNKEITLAQTLIQIKAAKPKVVTTAATTATTTRPKDRGVVVQEPSEFRVPQEIKPSSSKDKGKGIMIEPEVPLKRKDQIALDEQIARDIQAKLDAELLEEQKLARKQEEEANIALIESWENTQAMMEADRLLAERLQSKEREELTDEEKAKLFMELMEKRRKHFAALRAQEKRNRPPTKAQKRTQMSTYLKHMGGYTYKQLKGKSFDEIQKLFDKEMKRVNTFVAMGSEVQENKEKKEEGREETAKGSRKKMLGRKRAGKEQQKESSKKQKVEEEKESEEVDEDDEVELKKLLVIKKDEDIAIDAIPLATKLPVIIDYKLHKEGIEDLEAIWRIVKAKYGDTRPEDEFERVLYGDLRVMFEPDIKSNVWRMLQGYMVTTWKLINSTGVHFCIKPGEIEFVGPVGKGVGEVVVGCSWAIVRMVKQMADVAQNINNTTIRELVHLEQPMTPLPYLVASQATRDAYEALFDAQNEVACLMLGSMSLELHRTLENNKAYDMIQELKTMFEEQAKQELFEIVKAFHACKLDDGQLVSSYLLKMKSYLDTLECLGYAMPNELAELHAMLKLHEKGIPKKAETLAVLAIRESKIQKDKKKPQWAKGKAKGKNKLAYAPNTKIPPPPKRDNLAKDSICHHCKEVGH